MLDWIRKHPQRTAGFAIQVFGAVQMIVVALQAHIDPIVNAVVTAAFGGLVSILAWVQKNTKDEV